MRTALAAALLVALSVPAIAQSHGDRSSRSSDSAAEPFRPSIGLPLPPIGLPLPSIGLPLPQMGLPPGRTERSERAERPERPERFERRGHPGAVFLYWPSFGWPYPYPPETATAAPSAPAPRPEPRDGGLRIELQPGVDPQVYVDGYYAGLVSDAGGELTLDAGAHAIELREQGYETLHVDVQIAPDRVVTYRGELKPLRAAIEPPPVPAPEPVPPAATTIYVIPGCYVGNVPPGEAALPRGCDPGRAIAFPSRP